MQKITRDNCKDLCHHQFCGKAYTHYEERYFFGVPIIMKFCEKHARQIEDMYEIMIKNKPENMKRAYKEYEFNKMLEKINNET